MGTTFPTADEVMQWDQTQYWNKTKNGLLECYQLTWLGCKALGPLTFLDFSNCGEIFVIKPKVAMYESLATACKKRARETSNFSLSKILQWLERKSQEGMQRHKHLSHAFTVHLESFDIKISSRKSSFQTISNWFAPYQLEAHKTYYQMIKQAEHFRCKVCQSNCWRTIIMTFTSLP